MKKTMENMWKAIAEKLNMEHVVNVNIKMAAVLVLAAVITIGSGCAHAYEDMGELQQAVNMERGNVSEAVTEDGQEVQEEAAENSVQEDEESTSKEKLPDEQVVQESNPDEQSGGSKGAHGEEGEAQKPNTPDVQNPVNTPDVQNPVNTPDVQKPVNTPDTQEPEKPQPPVTPAEDTKNPVHTCSYHVEEEQAASCTEDGFRRYTCQECGKGYTVTQTALGHDFASYEVVTEATDLAEGLEKAICARESCDAEDERILAKLPHNHAYGTETERVEASCEQDGYIVRACGCGAVEQEILSATGHQEVWETVKTATCTESGTEVLKCKNCGDVSDIHSIPAAGHTEGGWSVDKEATCTETGFRHMACGICGETIATETLEARGHSFGGFEVTVEPGCTTAGEETRTCGICGEKGSVSIDAKGHSYGDWIVDQEATEEETGQRHKECSECGDVITEEVEQLPRHEHNFAESGRTDSTCETPGTITYSCSVCGESYGETIPVKSHQAGEWVMEKAPTETETGLRTKKCVNCNATIETEVLEKLPHLHEYKAERTEAGCETDGKVRYTCSCGDAYEEVIPAAGHRYEVTDTVEPGCEKEGSVTRTCSRCGAEATETLAALEHDMSVVSTTKATCTENGYTTFVCSRCGESSMEISEEVKGHTPGEWEITKEPALGQEGERTRACTECGEGLETETVEMLMTDGVDSVYFVDLGGGEQEMVIGHYDEEAATEIYRLVNEHRKSLGLNELELYDYQALTDTRAAEIRHLYEHVRPNGTPMRYGENILSGLGNYDAEYMFELWMQSPGHKANIERENYKYMGVSVFRELYITPRGTKMYETGAVQTFGRYSMEKYHDDTLGWH